LPEAEVNGMKVLQHGWQFSGPSPLPRQAANCKAFKLINEMKIRAYTQSDKESVITLLKANTPDFFDPMEQKDLERYLDHEIEDYFVVEEYAAVIGAGGINYFPKEKTARISWDIIKPDLQGKGIGRELTQYRINLLVKNKEVELIVVRTSQLVYKFYERMGFKLTKVEKDFWAPNLDLYQMELKKLNKRTVS
jgi:[ribosomal protein S18]-alanine N-acetyltransferase